MLWLLCQITGLSWEGHLWYMLLLLFIRVYWKNTLFLEFWFVLLTLSLLFLNYLNMLLTRQNNNKLNRYTQERWMLILMWILRSWLAPLMTSMGPSWRLSVWRLVCLLCAVMPPRYLFLILYRQAHSTNIHWCCFLRLTVIIWHPMSIYKWC